MHAQTFRCFGAKPGDGNPALVIEDDGMDLDARQAYAAARNTTCVFLDRDKDLVQVDYFYPHMRSPLCLHATLAVAAVLFARREHNETITVQTAMKGQRLELSREGDDYFVRLAPQPVPQPDIRGEGIAALLGAPGLALVSPPQVASVGSPKLLVEVQDAQTLHALAPDLSGIAAWGKQHGVNGLYVYCRLGPDTSPDGVFEGRNFNHLDPALEDSATGVAAGALAVALGHAMGNALLLRQGRASGRDCLIRARVEADAILVGGRAETA